MTTVITGVKELDRKLRRLATKDEKKISRKAVGKALTPIARAIRALAPVGKTKSLKKAIGKSFKKNKRKGVTEAKAGVNVGKKVRRKDGSSGSAPHGHLVTIGTSNRYTKTGASRGRNRANDFVNRGFNAAAGKSKQVLLTGIRDGLEKAAKQSP